MPLYAAFGVSIGNIGRGHALRAVDDEVDGASEPVSGQRKPAVTIISFFGHTGNFLAESASTDPDKVTARFKDLLDTAWVVRPLDDVRTALTAIADVPEPRTESGIRWTLGFAFHGGAGITSGRIATTPHAVLWRIAPHTIGAWKRDMLHGQDTLDRDRRGGGWGKVSGDVEGQLGGQWTARSCRTIKGLVRKAVPLEPDSHRYK